MGIFDSVLSGFGKVLENPIAQQAIGQGINYFTANQASKANQDAINAAGQQGMTNPYNVFSGFGNLIRNGNQLNFGGGASDALLGLSGAALSQYNPDPQAAAQQRYQLLTDLALPQENRNFQRLKDNLFASGREATTGGLFTGDNSLRAFQESSNTADLQRQLAGQDFAQAQNQNLYAQGTGFANAAFAPFGNLANASISAGAPNTAANTIVAGQGNNAQNANDAKYGAIGNILQGGFSWLTGQAPQIPGGSSRLSVPQVQFPQTPIDASSQYNYLQRPI